MVDNIYIYTVLGLSTYPIFQNIFFISMFMFNTALLQNFGEKIKEVLFYFNMLLQCRPYLSSHIKIRGQIFTFESEQKYAKLSGKLTQCSLYKSKFLRLAHIKL